jgi:hypothetical protein
MSEEFKPRPEDAFPIDALVGTGEVTLFTVPTRKYERAIYVLILSDVSGGANKITLRLYNTVPTLVTSIRIPLVINDTLPLVNPMDSPILKVRAGWSLRARAALASIQVHGMCYDL